MLRHLATICLAALAVGLLAEGCAEGGDEGGAGATSQGAGGGSGGSGGTPSGGGGAGGDGTGGSGGSGGCNAVDGLVLAMNEIFLGDVDYAHQTVADAWQLFGVDVDGDATVADFSGHCLPNNGADPATVFPDGNFGVDNAFGKIVMPLLNALIPGVANQANLAITQGQFTLTLALEGLTGATQDPLTTRYYGLAPLGGAPLWDGSDCWQVLQEDLTDPTDIESAVVSFAESSVLDDAWESGPPTTLVVPLNILGFKAPVTIYQARMSMQLSQGHGSSGLGKISGVVDTEEFVAVVRDVAGTILPENCTSAVVLDLLDDIRRASDILVDGNQDPGSVCNAISVGLGYTMRRAGLGGIADPATPQNDPCP
jgi:hypothetical protein